MNAERWRQIEDLCHEALRRHADERAAFLEGACRGDTALRRDVESLVAQESHVGGFLERASVPATHSLSALAPHTRVGAYEIEGLIGVGGMGEVYKARDTRLGRDVAMKIMPAALAADPDRQRRFEQEARAIAALNHPHICTLYDIGSDGGVEFLVMELLDGQTLAERLRTGPLPLTSALEYGAQIADALATAHRQGIVHRDLKPANLMVTKVGIKLLDFGLAKLKVPPGTALTGRFSAVALTEPVTVPGAALGTVPYMAPEQLEGGEADARADLFAFGCVLYEMLTGRRAFPGESQASIISAILSTDPPPVSALRPIAPSALDRLIARCLRKNRDDRAESAHDIAEELRSLSETIRAGETTATARRSTRRWWMSAAVAIVTLLAGGATVGWSLWQLTHTPRESVLPLTEVRVLTDLPVFAFAPDGSGVVFSGKGLDGDTSLYWLSLADSQARQLKGTEGASQPFFKPDGSAIGFVLGGKLYTTAFSDGRIPAGTVPTYLADAPGLRGASWGDDGTILFSPDLFSGLWRISEHGGDAQEITRLAGDAVSHRWPRVLPGRRQALFTVIDGSLRLEKYAIGLLDLGSNTWTPLVQGGSDARYLPSGQIVYASLQNALLAAPVDLSKRRSTGRPVTVLSDVQTRKGPGAAAFDVSPDGRLVYVAAQQPARQTLVSAARDGSIEMLDPERRAYHPIFGLSPDGTQLAAASQDGGSLSIFDMTRKEWMPLAQTDWGGGRAEGFTTASYPVWSPSGSEIVFTSTVDGPLNLFAAKVDGTGKVARLLPKTWNLQYAFGWTKGYIAYEEQESKSGWNTYVYSLRDHRSSRWGDEGKSVTLPAFSPDGRWLAYQASTTASLTSDSTPFDVFVGPFPGPGEAVRVSGKEGGKAPVWSSDGKEMFFLPSVVDNRVLASRVDGSGARLRVLDRSYVAFALPFPLESVGAYQQRVFAVSPQGKLVTFRPAPEPGHAGPDAYTSAPADQLRLITNWPELVTAKLAGRP